MTDGRRLRGEATIAARSGEMKTVERIVSQMRGLFADAATFQYAQIYAQAYGLRIVALAEPWAERRFIVLFRDADSLSAAARLLADHLVRSAA